MSEKQALNLLGLAYRARKVSSGIDTILRDIQRGKVHILLIATDVRKNTKKQLIDKCTHYDVPYIEFANRNELGKAIGKRARVAVGILDVGFARKFQTIL